MEYYLNIFKLERKFDNQKCQTSFYAIGNYSILHKKRFAKKVHLAEMSHTRKKELFIV